MKTYLTELFRYYNDSETADIKLRLRDESHLHAHRIILNASCANLARELAQNLAAKEISLANLDPEQVRTVIHCIYTATRLPPEARETAIALGVVLHDEKEASSAVKIVMSSVAPRSNSPIRSSLSPASRWSIAPPVTFTTRSGSPVSSAPRSPSASQGSPVSGSFNPVSPLRSPSNSPPSSLVPATLPSVFNSPSSSVTRSTTYVSTAPVSRTIPSVAPSMVVANSGSPFRASLPSMVASQPVSLPRSAINSTVYSPSSTSSPEVIVSDIGVIPSTGGSLANRSPLSSTSRFSTEAITASPYVNSPVANNPSMPAYPYSAPYVNSPVASNSPVATYPYSAPYVNSPVASNSPSSNPIFNGPAGSSQVVNSPQFANLSNSAPVSSMNNPSTPGSLVISSPVNPNYSLTLTPPPARNY